MRISEVGAQCIRRRVVWGRGGGTGKHWATHGLSRLLIPGEIEVHNEPVMSRQHPHALALAL